MRTEPGERQGEVASARTFHLRPLGIRRNSGELGFESRNYSAAGPFAPSTYGLGAMLTTESHPWTTELLEHNREYLHQLIENLRKAINEEARGQIELPPHRYYSAEVLEVLKPIYETLDRCRWSAAFVKTFPSADRYEGQGITRNLWIEYHYANFAVAYSSFRDLSLLLINQVFRLGIPPRLVSPESVLSNSWVADTAVPTAVKQVISLAATHQTLRNLYVHRGKIPDVAAILEDEDFRDLSLISFTNQYSDFVSGAERKLIASAYRMVGTDLQVRMKAEIELMDSALAELFSVLFELYQSKYKELGPINYSALFEEERRRRKLS
jgi:hypothetical protein